MSDCVDREAVATLIDELARAISDEKCGISRGRTPGRIMSDILALPAVEPERPTGHWIDYTATREPGETCYYRLWRCSNCDATLDMDEEEITEEYYCYNCGAKMEKNA